jgi:site-specific DNA recombinase
MHGMLASFAEYYSRNLANEVLKGAAEKAKRGGTPGRARLGRLNYDLLASPYYAGTVTYRGKQYEGRHPKLITQELFDQVQAVLKAHNHAGERDRKHQHYLKGTIRCGTCGCRLVYSQNKGNGGTYEYFVCPYYQNSKCPQGYQPVDLVEAAIEAHYSTATLTDAERDEIRQAVTKDLSERATVAQQEIDRCQRVLQELKEQERKLLHMHYEDRITGELFDDEQTRLRHRRQDAEP